jgi:hypothetical protein
MRGEGGGVREIKMKWFSMKKKKKSKLTCANKQRLIIAMGE